MSRSLYRAPFHRRLLPWIFVALFLVAAPALIFYTSGYRLNSKKNEFERNGALIVDSLPRGADILLNGELAGKSTPYTFQYLAPREYRIRLEKKGYFAWEKNLDVVAGQVTFVNRALLVKKPQSELSLSLPIVALESDDDRKVAALVADYVSSSRLTFWSAAGLAGGASFPAAASGTPIGLRWRESSDSVLVNLGEGAGVFLISTDDPFKSEKLPPDEVKNVFGSYRLEYATGTQSKALSDSRREGKLFALPSGNWEFAGERDDLLLLNDNDRWVTLDFGRAIPFFVETDPKLSEAQGDNPRWFETDDGPVALLVHDSELITWQPPNDPAVIWRQSEPIAQAAWHRSGRAVIFATDKVVSLLELDSRDGRQLFKLADFERVYDLAFLGRTLYVAAEKEGRHGVWSLQIE